MVDTETGEQPKRINGPQWLDRHLLPPYRATLPPLTDHSLSWWIGERSEEDRRRLLQQTRDALKFLRQIEQELERD
jgi:hypothetical protein